MCERVDGCPCAVRLICSWLIDILDYHFIASVSWKINQKPLICVGYIGSPSFWKV